MSTLGGTGLAGVLAARAIVATLVESPAARPRGHRTHSTRTGTNRWARSNARPAQTTLMPDTRYGSLLMSKFINCLMWDGKKATATRVVYDAMDQIKKKMPDADPVQVFTDALEQRQADPRSPQPSGRRGELPGADAGEAEAGREPGDAVDNHRDPRRRPAAPRRCDWPTS